MGRAPSLSLPHRYVTGTDARILLAVNWELVQLACSSPHVTGSLISQATVAPVRSEFVSSALLLPACGHLCFITALQQDYSAHLSVASSHLENPSHSNRDSTS